MLTPAELVNTQVSGDTAQPRPSRCWIAQISKPSQSPGKTATAVSSDTSRAARVLKRAIMVAAADEQLSLGLSPHTRVARLERLATVLDSASEALNGAGA